ncbi:MAG: FAD:protein FMN transferase, partial [Candidatus Hydrogenedentes bacterium]|nr:FAD:protein FMN transferase [Candidatus Hydrogenedentota bacterium]
MSSGPEQRSLSPMRIGFLVAGLVVISALSYYRLAEDRPKKPGRLVTFSGETMGTTYQVKGVAPRSADVTGWGPQIQIQIQARLAFVDGLMSTYKPQSELSRFNASNSLEPFEISRETAEVLLAALKVSDQSGGVFDITVGPIVNAYGFGPEVHVKPPSEDELEALKKRIGYEKLTVDMAALTVQKSQADVYCD